MRPRVTRQPSSSDYFLPFAFAFKPTCKLPPATRLSLSHPTLVLFPILSFSSAPSPRPLVPLICCHYLYFYLVSSHPITLSRSSSFSGRATFFFPASSPPGPLRPLRSRISSSLGRPRTTIKPCLYGHLCGRIYEPSPCRILIILIALSNKGFSSCCNSPQLHHQNVYPPDPKEVRQAARSCSSSSVVR